MAIATTATDLLSSVGKPLQERLSRFRREAPRSDEERAAAIDEVERLANFLDSRFQVLGFRFGWDAVLGLLPVVGDAAAATMSASIIVEAYRLGASKETIAKMIRNVALDAAVGSVPVAGSVFDFFFKANTRNLKLLRSDLSPEKG